MCGGVSLIGLAANAGCRRYLLAPVSNAVLDALATVGADTEDMEPETTESDGDDEDYAVAV